MAVAMDNAMQVRPLIGQGKVADYIPALATVDGSRLPAKSGVGGGIVAIVPHEMAIAVWSPELDDAGNSLAGIAVLEQLTKQLGRSVY